MSENLPIVMFKREYKTKYSFMDAQGRLKTSAIADIMQDIATAHVYGLLDSDCIWVMTRLKMMIYRPIGEDELIKAKTWCQDIKGPSYMRGYAFDIDGQRVVDVITSWVVINRPKSKIMRPSVIPNCKEYIYKQDDALEFENKISEFGDKECRNHLVSYSDLDGNGHFNNVRILETINDAIGIELQCGKMISSVEVEFLKEAKYDENILLKKRVLSENSIAVSGYSENVLKYTAIVNFQE